MKTVFRDILDIENVHGVMVLSFDGKTVYQDFNPTIPAMIDPIDRPTLTELLQGTDEAEIVFDRCVFYVIKSSGGYVMVVMGRQAPVAMVRLNCSIILPSLDPQKLKPKGLARFFSRKK